MTKVVIAYDGDCPFCKNYVRYIRLQKNIQNVELINLRHDSDMVATMRKKSLNPNDGIYVMIDDHEYFGDDAMTALAMISTKSDLFNRINKWIFKSNNRAKFCYPFLKFGRAITLKLLGRDPIK